MCNLTCTITFFYLPVRTTLINILRLIICFLLHWDITDACRLTIVVKSRDYSLWCTTFSLQWLLLWNTQAHRLQQLQQGLRSCGTQAQLPLGMWNLHGPGIEPVSPALAAGFHPLRHQGCPHTDIFSVLQETPRSFHRQFSSVAQSYPALCNPMDCSTPGLPVHHQLPEFTQTHVH